MNKRKTRGGRVTRTHTVNVPKMQQREKDYLSERWSEWKGCDGSDKSALSAYVILRGEGELFGTVTLTDSAGVECHQYKLDPMVRAQLLEHAEERIIPVSSMV